MTVHTIPHYDAGERKVIIERSQDVAPIIEANKRLQGIPQPSDWGRHVARVPNIILEKWLNEAWERGDRSMRLFSEDFNKMVKRKLQDPDWKFLRVDR